MMKWLKIGKETKTNWDTLLELQVKLDKINYDLDSPEWYWMRHEWNRLTVDKVATIISIRRISKLVEEEDYPSCIVENWWV